MLCIIERQRFIEIENFAPLRMQIPNRFCLLDGWRGCNIGNLVIVDGQAPQESRAIVGVLLDDLEHDRTDFGATTHQRKQQPIAVIQLGSIEFSAMQSDELLDVRRPEIISFECPDDAPVGCLHP